MAEDEGLEEKKDKDKLDRTMSSLKQKKISRTAVASKMSLKKMTESAMTLSSSSSSMVMKRPSSIDKMAKAAKYQNTYRLDSKKPFKAHEVYKILEAVVLREAEDYRVYDSFSASKLIQTIAAEVRTSVRLIGYDRYKICVLVYLGEKKFQGFQAAFRALWDHERDAWTTYYYDSRTYFISCTCFGIYHD